MTRFFFYMIPLLAGYSLDLLLGDPEEWPHPIRGFGWLIKKGEALLNHGFGNPEHRCVRRRLTFLKGMALTLFLCGIIYFSTRFFLGFLYGVHWIPGVVASSLGVYYGLANRQLLLEGQRVFSALPATGHRPENLEIARKRLSRIVGRDTGGLDVQQIRIAVLETLSENLSDGVIAPLFYYALGGVPGMLIYKMINTLDSMIGYRNKRYADFGKFAARLDDVVNFIPARLTALLMILVTGSGRGMRFMIRYGHQHKSPNAGYPEAALAGILDLRFGGPNKYGGQLVEKPFIGQNDRAVGSREIKRACSINQSCCLLMIVIVMTIPFIIQRVNP